MKTLFAAACGALLLGMSMSASAKGKIVRPFSHASGVAPPLRAVHAAGMLEFRCSRVRAAK